MRRGSGTIMLRKRQALCLAYMKQVFETFDTFHLFQKKVKLWQHRIERWRLRRARVCRNMYLCLTLAACFGLKKWYIGALRISTTQIFDKVCSNFKILGTQVNKRVHLLRKTYSRAIVAFIARWNKSFQDSQDALLHIRIQQVKIFSSIRPFNL